MLKKITFGLLIFLVTATIYGQNTILENNETSTIEGIIKDENGEPIINAIAICMDQEVSSDLFGNYSLEIPSTKAVKIKFTHPSFKSYSRRIRIRKKKVTIFSPKLINNLTIAF